MKKIMILGAASGQIPFINICKQKGAYVIVVSPKGNYPGIELADKFIDCDTRAKERILEFARQEKIDAITTDQTDVSVQSVAYVAEKLGLKGIGYQRAVTFSNKYEMRCAAKRIGINVPEFYKADNLEDAYKYAQKMKLPIIIKPVDSSGSRGVQRINHLDELEIFFEKTKELSGAKTVIMEEFIFGKEYLADGFAMNGKYINLDLGIKEYFDKPDMYISKMCMFSSAKMIDDEVEKAVLEANKRLVEGLGLEFGITHAEYLYSPEKKKVYLVEIAARGGGVYLSSHLTPKASGINTNELLLSYLLEDKVVDVEQLELDEKVAAWRCFELEEGTITNISGIEDLHQIDGVDKVCLEGFCFGKQVEKLVDDTTKYGPILVSGNTREDCFKTLQKVENTLQIQTQRNNEIYSIKW